MDETFDNQTQTSEVGAENCGVTLGEFEVADDMMLDGLKIVQDKRLYRFTSDSVLLSKFVAPKKGEKIADFCAGSGIVGFHFYALNRERLKDALILLVELQTPLAELSKKTIALNGFKNFSVENCALQNLSKTYNEQFSLIICNPHSSYASLRSAIKVCILLSGASHCRSGRFLSLRTLLYTVSGLTRR